MQTFAYEGVEIVTIPTVTAGAYTSGKQVGGIQTLTSACRADGRFSQLAMLTILDKDQQNAAFSILLFNQSPTIVSVDTGTFSATYANMQNQLVGEFTIQASDYISPGSLGVASLPFSPAFFKSVEPSGNLYAVAVTTGTPTYSTTTSLQFRWEFLRHF